jgi:hypothetical protein
MALALNKRTVGGKAVSGTGDFDYLYDQGFITKDEKKLLNAIKYDETKGEFYMDRDYKGGGVSASQQRSLVNRVNSIFNQTRPKSRKVNFFDELKTKTPKPPKAPKLKLAGTTKSGGRTSTRWFDAY